MQAVITADIVNSSKLNEDSFDTLIKSIKDIYRGNKIEFYRGDSFQVLVKHAAEAFEAMLMTRLWAISTREDIRIDIRQSIRIGNVKNKVKQLGSYVDDTFLHSGRTFDQLEKSKKDNYLLITCGIETFDVGYSIIADYTDTLLSLITPTQALALYYYLTGMTQKDIAGYLNKSGPTINKQIKLGRVEEIIRLTEQYTSYTKLLEAHGK